MSLITFNIIMKEDKRLKLIDFETSMYAPIDYELDIFLRMCRNPLKYASEEEEKLIDVNDYKMIEPYFRKLYPEIFEIHDFEIRNKIYLLTIHNMHNITIISNWIKMLKFAVV